MKTIVINFQILTVIFFPPVCIKFFKYSMKCQFMEMKVWTNKDSLKWKFGILKIWQNKNSDK